MKFVVTQQGAVQARKTKNNPLLKAMQELPPIGFKTYAFSLHCHFLQTLRICPPREGKHLGQLDSFPLPLDKEQSFAKVKWQCQANQATFRNTSKISGSTQIQLQHQDFQYILPAAVSETKIDLINQICFSVKLTGSPVHLKVSKDTIFRGDKYLQFSGKPQ